MASEDVADGFTARAEGDLTIKGVAMGAKLEASGTLVLMNGMFGHGVGEIVAHGPLEAGFLQECTVTCGATVAVSREIVRSTVTAADSVIVTGDGKIIGGAIQAGHEISAKTIGALSGSMTKLTIVPRKETVAEAAATAAGRPGGPRSRSWTGVYPLDDHHDWYGKVDCGPRDGVLAVRRVQRLDPGEPLQLTRHPAWPGAIGVASISRPQCRRSGIDKAQPGGLAP